MKLASENVMRLCRAQGLSVDRLLKNAGVSRNAYYSLCRKESILPASIRRIARELEVPEDTLLEESASAETAMRRLLWEAGKIARKNPGVDPDNVRHTLLLLEEKPEARLRRALLRGRTIHIRK